MTISNTRRRTKPTTSAAIWSELSEVPGAGCGLLVAVPVAVVEVDDVVTLLIVGTY